MIFGRWTVEESMLNIRNMAEESSYFFFFLIFFSRMTINFLWN